MELSKREAYNTENSYLSFIPLFIQILSGLHLIDGTFNASSEVYRPIQTETPYNIIPLNNLTLYNELLLFRPRDHFNNKI